jgi:ATP-binding cassette subfamily G (WHITE) protein 1
VHDAWCNVHVARLLWHLGMECCPACYLWLAKVLNIVMSFPEERSAFVREHRAGMYSAGQYYVSKILVELPFQIAFPVIFCAIIVPPLRLQGRIWIFMAMVTILNNVGQAMGTLLGCSFKSKEVAMQFLPLVILPVMIFGGLFVNLDSVPVWLRWMQYCSPVRWSFNAMMREELSGLKLVCTPKQAKPDGSCPFDLGDQILDTMGLQYSILDCLSILLGMYAALRLWAFCMILKITRQMKG